MDTKVANDILNLFVSSTQNYSEPMLYEGKAVATDGNILILLDSSYGIQKESIIRNINEIFVINSDTEYVSVDIDIQVFQQALLSIPKIEIYKEHDCEDCDGSGTHTCECGHEHDCISCHGQGSLDSKEIEGYEYDDRKYAFSFKNTYMSPNKIEMIAKAMAICGETKCSIKIPSNDNAKIVLFSFGSVQGGCMPRLPYYWDKVIKIIE